jgi:hypothetical protein
VMLPGPVYGGTTVPIPISLISHKPDYILAHRLAGR